MRKSGKRSVASRKSEDVACSSAKIRRRSHSDDEDRPTPRRKCCLTKCGKYLSLEDARAEFKAKNSRSRTAFAVEWRLGEGSVHRNCWDEIVKASRSRSKVKRSGNIILTDVEKRMIKEAARSVEFHDSSRQIAEEVADMIQSAEHCIAFTGAGVSTAAGIGDYRGKSGKWTEEE